SFKRLSRTREELIDIAQWLLDPAEAGELFPELRDLPRTGSVHGRRFDLLVGREASESRLKDDLSPYRILHLGVHGYFDPEYPWFSGLVLSPETEGGQAGFLNLMEIGTLKLDAELVFLAACETGQGKLVRCDGIQSTARSFLIAGARAVIATQGSVDDIAAAKLAKSFYQRVIQGVPPSTALRETKLWYLEHGGVDRGARQLEATDGVVNRHAHPYFWAPFSLWG